MSPLRFITRVFIDVFGITHPTPQQERRAARFIGALLGVIAVGLAMVFLVLYSFSHR